MKALLKNIISYTNESMLLYLKALRKSRVDLYRSIRFVCVWILSLTPFYIFFFLISFSGLKFYYVMKWIKFYLSRNLSTYLILASFHNMLFYIYVGLYSRFWIIRLLLKLSSCNIFEIGAVFKIKAFLRLKVVFYHLFYILNVSISFHKCNIKKSYKKLD